jgi:hypothetical protein
MGRETEEKYPRVGWAFYVIFCIISFIWCPDWKHDLERVLLPGLSWWPLKAMAQTAILMGYFIPLSLGYALTQIRYSFFQVIGLSLMGLGFGIVLRICLVFVGIMTPSGYL